VHEAVAARSRVRADAPVLEGVVGERRENVAVDLGGQQSLGGDAHRRRGQQEHVRASKSTRPPIGGGVLGLELVLQEIASSRQAGAPVSVSAAMKIVP